MIESPPISTATAPDQRPAGRLGDYLAIARPDHWIKHVFMVPGIVLAWVEQPPASPSASIVLDFLLGFVSAALVASANYVLNEWLDAGFDRHHPTKSKRPAVARRLRRGIVIAEYLALAAGGLALAATLSPLFAAVALVFLISGWVYNLPPLRTKDRAYLDVISEAVNNPIRLTLGWALIDAWTLPPSSLLLAYWMGGAFLMAIKRLAEFRTVTAMRGGVDRLQRYRRSFRGYSEKTLLVSAFLYAQLAAFFLAVFLIKYRIEYLLSLPLFALLFAVYLRLGLKDRSAAQAPETLWRERALVVVVVLLVATLGVLTVFDMPALEKLTDPHFIRLPW